MKKIEIEDIQKKVDNFDTKNNNMVVKSNVIIFLLLVIAILYFVFGSIAKDTDVYASDLKLYDCDERACTISGGINNKSTNDCKLTIVLQIGKSGVDEEIYLSEIINAGMYKEFKLICFKCSQDKDNVSVKEVKCRKN